MHALMRKILASAGNRTPIPLSPIRSLMHPAGQDNVFFYTQDLNDCPQCDIYAHPILKVTEVMNHYMTRDHQLVYNQMLKLYEK